jgi:conjugative relaxase-like TrwC/TraI family protein
MVGVTKIQRGNAGYWLAAVAEGGDDYYTKPGEAPGEWVGDLADELGLAGQVDAAAYGAILEGRDPLSGQQLVARPDTRFRHRPDGSIKRVEPVLGYDVRFSAPKSISLLYALGSERTRERIVGVLDEAVRQGIAHLEQQACMVQRGKGGKVIKRGRGFVGMAFRHRMSRAGDPALHVHVLISNLTRAASDGKWLSLASPKGRSPLFPHGKSAGIVFQASLRAGFLREFGLEFGAVKNGYADLKGFSRELIKSFSTRSREIAVWMQEHGASGVAAKQTAAYRTRQAKDHGLDEDERRSQWEVQAAPHGFTRECAESMISEAQPREPRPISESSITGAIRQLEKSSSHFDARQLLSAIGDQLPEGADNPQLIAAVDRVLGSDKIVQLHTSQGLLDKAAYTTPRIAALERRFLDAALGGVDAEAAVVKPETLHSVLARHDYLGADQREMVTRLTSGGEAVVVVTALPGTGKTVALKAAAEAWADAGFRVLGCATAKTATGELIRAGVRDSFSITSLRFQIERLGRRLPHGTVIVVDEANVTNTFDLEALRAHVAAVSGKLVLVGDTQQIGSIGPGGLYVHLAHQLGPIRLTEIRRQDRPVDRRIVTLVHEGRGSEALDLLRTDGKLIVGDDLPSTLHALLLDWYRDFATGADAVMIARRNSDVEHLNDQARQLRREEGKLGRFEVMVGDKPISRGDRVITRINNRQVANRDRWEVLSVNPLTRSVKLRDVDDPGRVVKLGRDYLSRQARDGSPALQHAYAITKFGAESKTFDRAYPLLDAGANLEQELVAISRGRRIANVYTVASSELLDPDLGPGRREVSDTLQDLREAMEREGADTPAIEQSLSKKVEGLSLSGLAGRRELFAQSSRVTDPLRSRRHRLEAGISRSRGELRKVTAERERFERRRDPPARVAELESREISLAESIAGDEAELASLPLPDGAEPVPPQAEERLEAALIERRISTLARREVAAARSGESEIIYKTLGPYPADPAEAAVWSDAAHAIATYRLRHFVRDREHPLGGKRRGGQAGAEYQGALRRIQAAQRQLAHQQEHSLRASETEIGL